MDEQPAAPSGPQVAQMPAEDASASPAAKVRRKDPGNAIVTALVVLALGYLVGVYALDWPSPLAWIAGVPFEWQAATPEFIVLLFALLAPIVGLWDTDRRGMQQFAFIPVAGAF